MKNPILIFGAGYLGRAVKEIFEGNSHVVYGFLDDNKELHGTEIDNIPVLGGMGDNEFLDLIGKQCEAFVAVDDNALRKSLMKLLNEKKKVQPVNAFHSKSHIPESVHIGHGNLVDAGVFLGAGATIGNHGLFHGSCHIGSQATVGNFVQIGMGALVNPEVVLEDEVFIGSGVVLVSGVTIGKGARVGAGSVVINSIKPGETVFGNPAQPVGK